MVRTQVSLNPEQMKALRQLSAATGRSIADLVREGVDCLLASQRHTNRSERVERAIRAAGRFESGKTDVSIAHDRYLAEAYEK